MSWSQGYNCIWLTDKGSCFLNPRIHSNSDVGTQKSPGLIEDSYKKSPTVPLSMPIVLFLRPSTAVGSVMMRPAYALRPPLTQPSPTDLPASLTAVQRSLIGHPLASDVAGTQGWSSWPCSCSVRRLSTPLVARLAPPPVARRVTSLPG